MEREAEIADNIAVTKREEAVKTAEQEEQAVVSMRLAYQDLEIQQKKKDQAMSKMDPKKAQQMERLGMGFSNNTGFGSTKSHSLMSDVGVIVQVRDVKYVTVNCDFGLIFNVACVSKMR